ncbi:hypothetical protein [Desulfovibrio litoralis]|uniref:Uncharacterized protein n=1 Tax=Desulfovibrio litoralis DSM 11393 TaxID=1121455 RepID=A0A1M7RW88_9BACT|nr:hypothetical protein [Desulfovibrio litoralis]SHN50569.1 hypothetical protein SAMN02745728_00262 [Desulfovibrio litoralis DSM 11393]
MWNKLSKSRRQDIVVIVCGISLVLIAKLVVLLSTPALPPQ